MGVWECGSVGVWERGSAPRGCHRSRWLFAGILDLEVPVQVVPFDPPPSEDAIPDETPTEAGWCNQQSLRPDLLHFCNPQLVFVQHAKSARPLGHLLNQRIE